MKEHLRFVFLCFLPPALIVGLGLWALTGEAIHAFFQVVIVSGVMAGAWLTYDTAHDDGYAEGYTDAWVEAERELEGWDE